MDFRLSDDQLALAQNVRDFLAKAHGPETLRALDAGRVPQVPASLVDMGLPGLLVPEAHGGLGLTRLDAAVVAVELGRANVSEPFVEAALVGAPLLARTGEHAVFLAALATGEARLALQHPINAWVLGLDGSTHLLQARTGRLLLGASPRGTAIEGVDPLRPLFQPAFAGGAWVGASADELLDMAALVAAAQLLGAAEQMLELATEYAKTREQFGQPIGGFQAIKHMLASVMVAIEFARPVLWRAAQALDDGRPTAAVHVSHAKVTATDAAMFAAETAIQVHGAMGYTYEVDLHFWMKRAWALAGAWGSRAFHLSRVDDATIGGRMPIGADATFA